MVKTARGMGSIPIQGNKMLSCSVGGPKEAGRGGGGEGASVKIWKQSKCQSTDE